MSFMDVCTDMCDDGEEIVSAIPFLGGGRVHLVVGCVGCHVQGCGESDVVIYFCLTAVKALR